MFNLKARKRMSTLERIRGLSEDCRHIKMSDLDGLGEDDLADFIKNYEKTASVKLALHGVGETWTAVPSDYSPYHSSPLVNSNPEFGGRWKKNFPGEGSQHINDDRDKDKSGQGEAINNDFNKKLKDDMINNVTEDIRGPRFVIRKRLSEEERPTDELAKKIFGPDGKYDEESVFVILNGFERAMGIQRKIPGSTIETKGE
jgi:hypothetical protein